MSNYFLSYKYTNEKKELVLPLLNEIEAILVQYGNEVFCSINLQDTFKKAELDTYNKQLAYCIQQQKKSDIVLGIIWSKYPSKGMAKELKQAKKLKQDYVLYIQKDLKYDEFRKYAKIVHEFTNLDDLVAQIKVLGLNS